MAQEETLRPRYWHGQYLRAGDFEAAVEYQRAAHRRHLLGGHTWGIVDGLDLVERPRLGSETVVDHVLLPGTAVDGYGRSLVVLREVALPLDLFASVTVERWVEVWLEYRAADAEPAGFGWERCDDPSLTYRTQETWDLVVGEQAHPDEGITVDGRLVPDGERPADGSVPVQALPDDDEDRRWLVSLGQVLWNGTDGFVPLTTVSQQATRRVGRRAAGVVAGSVLAPDDDLVLARRSPAGPVDPADALDPADPGVRARLAGSLGIDRDLGVRTVARTATPLTVRATGPTEEVLGLLRSGAGTGGWHVQLAPGGTPALTVREGAPGSSTARLAIQEGGRVGIGTTTPDRNLTVRSNGGTFVNVVDDTHGQVMVGQDAAGSILSAMTTHDLVLRSGGNVSRLWIKADGRVGVGTSAPDRDLTVSSDSGTYANLIDTSSSVQVLLGADGSGGIISTMTNHDLQLRAGANSTKVIVKATGKVGIGTTAPDQRLTVEGLGGTYVNARDTASGTELLIGADGSGGIVSTISNHDLQVRAGGNSTKLIVKAGGNVGIGTTVPDRKLTIEQTGGAYVTTRDPGSGTELLIGADSGGGVVSTMTNHDLQLRAGANSTKAIVKASGNVGVGTLNPSSRLHVAAALSGSAASLSSHVMTVENTSTSADADVLALKVGSGSPGGSNNYISFFRAGTAAGRIEATASGVTYETSGNDFAEFLLVEGDVTPQPGQVVAVRSGRVSLATEGATHVSVVATVPGFVGNAPPDGELAPHARVVLLGQAPVRVRGAVRVGDVLLPSGTGDGRAIGVSPGNVPFGASVIGQAWTAHAGDDPSVGDGEVVAAIGMAAVATAATGERLVRLEAAVTGLMKQRDDDRSDDHG